MPKITPDPRARQIREHRAALQRDAVNSLVVMVCGIIFITVGWLADSTGVSVFAIVIGGALGTIGALLLSDARRDATALTLDESARERAQRRYARSDDE